MEIKESLTEQFLALNAEQRRSVHFALCEHAVEKWNLYAKTQKKIEYIETVTSTRQKVDKLLPFDAFSSTMQGLDSSNVAERYLEPIVALQDADLILPENITFAYYAIYHLFKKYVKKELIDDWLIVNQALATEEDSEVWKTLLNDAIQRAKS